MRRGSRKGLIVDYLAAHPDASPGEVADATGVKLNTTQYYMRELRVGGPSGVAALPDDLFWSRVAAQQRRRTSR